MEPTVKQRFIHMTARKLRRVAGVVRGQNAEQAIAQLSVLPLVAAKPMAHAIKSALTAAKARDDNQQYVISLIHVDEGPAMKRRILKSRGRATRMEHRMSHISITLSPATEPVKTKQESRRGA